MLISLVEWAGEHGISPATARQRALRGSFRTAQKIGRNWVIDSEENRIDNRIKKSPEKPGQSSTKAPEKGAKIFQKKWRKNNGNN